MPDSAPLAPAPRLSISPLSDAHVEPLAALLWDERVYRHIGGLPSGPERVALALRRALAGPPPEQPPQRWLNYGMWLRGSGELIGRLEATLHDGLAEVAFLMGPAHWGQGYAVEGLQWLHGELARVSAGAACWATTVPENLHCQRLLARCGYAAVAPESAPDLMSYDAGDRVFHRPADAG